MSFQTILSNTKRKMDKSFTVKQVSLPKWNLHNFDTWDKLSSFEAFSNFRFYPDDEEKRELYKSNFEEEAHVEERRQMQNWKRRSKDFTEELLLISSLSKYASREEAKTFNDKTLQKLTNTEGRIRNARELLGYTVAQYIKNRDTKALRDIIELLESPTEPQSSWLVFSAFRDYIQANDCIPQSGYVLHDYMIRVLKINNIGQNNVGTLLTQLGLLPRNLTE